MVGWPSSHETACYRIRVAGRLDAVWSERAGGMTLVVHEQDPPGVWSELHGRLPDQTALMALLEQLALRGIVVLACGREPDTPPGGPPTTAADGPSPETER